MRRIAVIGAGWAGLAAAVTLIEQRAAVTLYEAARQPGGRARRVDLEGKALDNGQHILVGAYRKCLRLMRQVGADPERLLLRLPLHLRMAEGFELRCPRWLPAPFDTLYALAAARGLSAAERVRALRFAGFLHRHGYRLPQDEPLGRLLARHEQQGTLQEALWGPLCVAALNTPVERASAQVFLHTLRDTLNGGRGASDLLLPRASLGAIFPEAAIRYLAAREADLRIGTVVRRLTYSGRHFDLDGEAYDQVVLAVAPQHVPRLLAELPACAQLRADMQALEYQPIYTCYLQYDPQVRLPLPMLGFREGLVQWAFDRGALDGHHGLIATVISAEGPHEHLERDELAAAVSASLQPSLGHPGAPRWHRIIAEKRATFACYPNLRRPAQTTALAGLFLAGDYTESDYPGTLEGAIRSGVQAAQLVLSEATA